SEGSSAGARSESADLPVVSTALAKGDLLRLVLHLLRALRFLPDQVGHSERGHSGETTSRIVCVATEADSVLPRTAARLKHFNGDVVAGALDTLHWASPLRMDHKQARTPRI